MLREICLGRFIYAEIGGGSGITVAQNWFQRDQPTIRDLK